MGDSPAERPVVANGAAIKRLVETVPDEGFRSDVEKALHSIDSVSERVRWVADDVGPRGNE